ncbi:MAG TPA: hypothetical protein PK095_15220, partial [Myxococcota bacterium]|nr:hypothetical protein [Myxococcota bacterium]
TLTSGPEALTAETAASFAFTSPDEGARFECRVDGGEFAPCESGASFAELADGDHVFEVRAIDAAGNADPTPARWTWTVDTRGPVVSIVAGPADPSQSGEASFGFASDEPAELRCALDVTSEDAPDVTTWPVCPP